MEISNNILAVLVLLAMTFSVVGTATMLSLAPTEPFAVTGFQVTEMTGTAQVSLESEVAIWLVVNTVNFNNIDNLFGTQNDTTDFSPHPFVVRNNGTVLVNISIAEDNSSSNELWDNDDNFEYAFQFNSTPNGTTSGALQYYSFTNFGGNQAEAASAAAVVTNPANLVFNLTQLAAGKGNDVTVHLNISVPGGGEPAGAKSTSIFFKAAEA